MEITLAYLSATDGLTDEHALIYRTARQFAEQELTPLVQERPGDGTLPLTALTKLASAGLLAAPYESGYGAGSIDTLGYTLLCEAIGGVSPSLFTSALTVQISLVGTAIAKFGSERQREDYLKPLLEGRMLGAFALTEPDSGSDPASGTTRVELQPDGRWLLNGTKYWISNGSIADVLIVFAQTNPGSRHRGMAAFIVDGNGAGVTRTPIPGKLGLHESDTAAVYFDNVALPANAILGAVGDGFKIAQTSLQSGRLSTAASAVGIGQACLDASIRYAGQRAQWGKPIGGHQMIQDLVAEMATDVAAARLLTRKAAADVQAGSEAASLTVPMAKFFSTEAAVKAARNAISLHGGVGYVDEYPVAGLLRDAIGLSLYEGTSHIQKLIIGRELLGVSAFS